MEGFRACDCFGEFGKGKTHCKSALKGIQYKRPFVGNSLCISILENAQESIGGRNPVPSKEWEISEPRNDDDYFGRMTKAFFSAGLNWKVIDNKWPNFRKAFANFSIGKVSKFSERNVRRLLKDEGIIRNERKIRSTIFNAQESLKLKKEFGSFRKYVDSFGKDHAKLIDDLKSRFHNLGDSSSRTFLWMSGVKLEPTEEEKQWLAKNE